MSNGTDLLEVRRKATPPSAPTPPEPTEDAGSQALSEALRSSFVIVKIVLVVMVLVFLGSGFFTVGPQEKAVILRLGKPVGKDEKALLGPGPHWAFPYPIDEVVRIPIGQAQTIRSTVGWYATTAAMEAAGTLPPARDSLSPGVDGYALTGDGNIMHVRGVLRYRIAEPGLDYKFAFADASNAVLNAFNNALNYASASYPVDGALSRDVSGFREKVRLQLERTIARQKLGIVVDQIDLQTSPPLKLREAFAAVSEAEARRGKELLDARSYANQTVNQAQGEAAIRIAAGETDKTRMVQFVSAEANRFKSLLPEYQKNPELFRNLRQLETLQRIFTNAQVEKYMLPTRGGKPLEVRIQVNREPEKLKTIEPPKAEGH
jgi:modulator of FtsH protease HflK